MEKGMVNPEIRNLLKKFDSFLTEPETQRIQDQLKRKDSQQKPLCGKKETPEIKKQKQVRMPQSNTISTAS